MCRWLPSGRRGLCIGLGFALPNLLQFLVDWLLKITAAPPLCLWGLLLVVLAFMATLLLQTKTWGLEEQPIAPRPLITRNLPLLCCICAIMGLLVGLNDTVSLVRYDEYVDFHFLSRVYSAIGFLLAGWLADHYPLWLPLTALLSKAVVLGFHVLAHILKDRSINEMAEELFISPSTVKFHVANLLKKTGAGSQRRLKQIVSEYDRFLDESQNKKADNE